MTLKIVKLILIISILLNIVILFVVYMGKYQIFNIVAIVIGLVVLSETKNDGQIFNNESKVDKMSYNYESEKHAIFTEENQLDFLKIRDQIFELLDIAGAFKINHALRSISGDNWTHMAMVDRMVELNEICEITGSSCRGQERVFIKCLK